jgi:hypothetical protein
MSLQYDDPSDYDETIEEFTLPFKVEWLYGVGCTPNAQPGDMPTPTHDADVVITDANDRVVFDSTLAAAGDFVSKSWGSRLHVYGWETNDAILWMVTHTAWPTSDDEPSPRQYDLHISPTSAVIDERAIKRRPKRVKSMTVVLDNYTRTAVDWLEGFNMNITHEGEVIRGNRIVQEIVFDAAPGGGLGRFPICDEEPLVIRAINGTGPNDDSDFLLRATDCYAVRQPTDLLSLQPRRTTPEPATLTISNDCDPCCPCEDYETTANYMNRIRDIYKATGRDAEATRDQYHENRDRWNLSKCCFEQHPIRLILQPQVCPYIDVAGQFCNMTDQCVQNFVMLFDFREDNAGIVDVSSSGLSVGQSESLGLPNDPSYEVEVVPGFTYIRGFERAPNRRSGKLTRYDLGGEFPQFNAFWDTVEPYQTVWVRFRLKVVPPPTTGSESLPGSIGSLYDGSTSCPVSPLSVRVAVTGNTVGKDTVDPILVPNCTDIPDDPVCAEPNSTPTVARAVGEAVLNCPSGGGFFWDPYLCGGN